jgi:hypothetical protein
MVMASKQLFIIVIMILLVSNLASASGLSVTLKRTNPGIAGIKPSEIIFDIVNTDMENWIEGFILCRSPDDVSISSTIGMAAGSGAQYISPKFNLDTAPSQKTVYFLIESNYQGDYTTNCILKYIPYKIDKDEKIYIKMNLDETKLPKDYDYRELRLDKNVPIIESKDEYISAYCPRGKATCKTEEVIISKHQESNDIFLYLTIILLISIIIMLIIIMMKKRSK